MNLRAKTTFKHAGQTFLEGVVYDVNNSDAEYFLAAKWMEKTKNKSVLTVGELGFDPETKWAGSDKKIIA